MEKLLTQMADHLETLEYETTVEDEGMRAGHDVWFNFGFRSVGEGALLQLFIKAKEGVNDKLLREWLNELNQEALVARYLIDKDGDVACEAWYPGPFDKDGFDRFMQAWHHDLAVLAENERSGDVLS